MTIFPYHRVDFFISLWYDLIMNNTNKISRPYKSMTTDALKVRRQELLGTMPDPTHVMRGSLITRSIKCGKLNCKCAYGEGHKSLYLSSYYNGKTQLDSVPKVYSDKVSQCIKDYEDITALLAELSCINLELFRRREADI